ncbi:class I SAM-dependent methyltransferase [Sphaerisporangium sp. TRM90804]|uniref:class I SAM-dependent methyltransferase n=1 Tax=Sphaerisporangium sp. TRM90804 TaxID=3031113 RepID=UPI0024497908|nr:class I SAM-dependent methyltransferase [Sphaerisporangium sp. TRM90804]MDH2429462.1 class I SAM-dependent methyltransferase [Sphaerisporangium sp. TRM90804]
MVNTSQIEEWNGEGGRYWAAHQERYDVMLSRLTTHLVAAMELAPADRVLDAGCGCGFTTRVAAARVTEGSVLGVDLSEPMLARARESVEREGLRNVRFERADVQVRDFPEAAFDVVISRLGLMFFDDPEAAFANLFRALRPGGRLVFLCWQEMAANEHRVVPLSAMSPYLSTPPRPSTAPGAFSLGDPERLRGLLGGAGFADVVLTPVTEPVLVGGDAADAADFLRRLPSIRTPLEEVDEPTAAKAVDAMRDALAAYETPQGVQLGSAAWLVRARRP